MIAMGVLGCPEFYKWNHQFEANEFFFTNICTNCLYHGIDWLYTAVETIYSYDFRVWYFWFFNSIYDDSFDFFFSSFWYFNLSVSAFQLFWAVILDQYVTTLVYKLPYTEEWFRSMLSSKEATLVLIYHPELSFIKEEIFQEYFFSFFSNFVFSIYDLV